MTEIKDERISLFEVLVKTSFQTQITDPSDKKCENPVAFGSGFIVDFDGDKFFVTADHTVHLDDYNKEIDKRTWNDYTISIFNEFSLPDNFLTTVVTPLGGFYYMEQFQLDKPQDAHKPVDIAVCKMKRINFQYPFMTHEVKFPNETIYAGEQKLYITKECFDNPNEFDEYFVFGTIRTKIKDSVRLERVDTIKRGLKYILKSGDYYLLNTPELINDTADWEGLSGSPVLSESGECIGVLCSVNEKTKSIWVMPISMIKMLIEVAIQQEKIEINK
jgi:hypothetical protein